MKIFGTSLILSCTALFLFFVSPLSAASHESGMGSMDHGAMQHDGMDIPGDMILVGNQVQDGVRAMVHLKDVQAAMAKMGMETTHHLMVMFEDQSKSAPVESGSAAVKITPPGGKESAPIPLMGMQGHFGADVQLSGPGVYHFTIGTKLADGRKRQYDFDFTLR